MEMAIVALFTSFLLCFLQVSAGRDTISPTETLGDNESLISGNFVLGFFRINNNKYMYLGVWYTFSPEAVVWVANRQFPITGGARGVLRLTARGNLTLTNQSNNVTFWSSDTSSAAGGAVTAQLLDTGNLVVRLGGGVPGLPAVWQSFDHPADTLLPGMKLGLDLGSGLNRVLTAWRSNEDPSPSDVACEMDPDGSHEIYVDSITGRQRQRQLHTYRFGPWNGRYFSGIPRMSAYANKFNYTFVRSAAEVYYSFTVVAAGISARLVVRPDTGGYFERLVWLENARKWEHYWKGPDSDCDKYGRCGPNGVCSDTPELCGCYVGFAPRKASAWQQRDFGAGCGRKTKLGCGTGDDGFCPLTGMKLPDTSTSSMNMSMSLSDCMAECLRNCSCIAYAAATISGPVSGCIMWSGDLVDTRSFTDSNVSGQLLYLRLPTSELDNPWCNDYGGRQRKQVKVIVGVVFGILLLVVLCGLCIWRMKAKKMRKLRGMRIDSKYIAYKWKDEVPLFGFAVVAASTDNFSDENTIGKGGFGRVYKGTMADGQVVAIKRLSMNSGQGLDEFMNEVMLIAKLQHKNLVRLLGCCIEGEERMLVYEYMQNRSLDGFIFDKNKSVMLNWRKRVAIICGIARGLLYLHQDSRLKVIHRDLKAANVLLDEEMDPKISDFGTARILGKDQIEQNTRRVIGTFGYMSPEYVIDGIFSVKSDVFSFGVLVLETISGRKNRVVHQDEHSFSSFNLLELTWRLWKNGSTLELLDDAVASSSFTESEFVRLVQIGLLCVQECAVDRPTMASVVFMLSSDSSTLPEPEKPGFVRSRRGASASGGETHSSDFVRQTSTSFSGGRTDTCTIVDGR